MRAGVCHFSLLWESNTQNTVQDLTQYLTFIDFRSYFFEVTEYRHHYQTKFRQFYSIAYYLTNSSPMSLTAC